MYVYVCICMYNMYMHMYNNMFMYMYMYTYTYMGRRLLTILLKPLQLHLSHGGPKISHLEGMWEEVRRREGSQLGSYHFEYLWPHIWLQFEAL